MGRSRHLFLLFFLSGISGLVYESLWSRYLKLFVGSAATAQILVLALFMGGMSLGSLLAGRYSARISKPILTYGLIEGLIGLYALAFPYLYTGVTRLCYDVVFPAVGGDGVALAKWTAAGLLIAPPCILLGTTFPLMSVGILRRDRERSGEILSFLYFSNSFGASLGAVISGFLLIPWLGLPGTLAAAAVLNLAIMAVCLRERRRDPDAPLSASKKVEAATTSASTSTDDSMLLTVMLAIALGTGLSSFMYEIAWIRMLSMVLGSASHSFEVMLSVFVFGLALGGLWVRKRMDKFTRPELVLGRVQVIMGAAAVLTIPGYQLGVWGIGGVYWASERWFEGERTIELWYMFNAVRYVVCLIIMLPATFCAGMTLPLVTHVLLRRGQTEAAVGRVYGVNTLGAIIGATSAGLLLLPLLGIKNVIVLGAAIDMALGIWLIRREQVRHPSRSLRNHLLIVSVVSLTTALVGFLRIEINPRVLAAGVFRRGTVQMHEDYVVRLHEDGRTATVTVTQDIAREGYHTLFTNGKPDASIRTVRYPAGHDPDEGPILAGDEPTQLLLGIIPLMVNSDARFVATIGMGSGVTSHTILASPTLERLDTVEIEPFMAEGAKLFHPINRRTFEDPRSRIIFDDAKAYFAAAEAKYDIVVSEPSNPWVAGVSSLFTVEFYAEIKRYLADDGILGQWMHGYELSDELLLSVLAAVDRSFADYKIYRVGDRDWLILAATADGGIGELDPAALGWPDLHAEAGLLGIHAKSQIDALLVANDELLRPYLSTLQPNTDARPLLDNGAERARFFKRSAEALLELRAYPLPLAEVLGGAAREPYSASIPDFRTDEHVLEEPERALYLMQTWEREDRDGSYTGAAAMRSYLTQRDNIASKPGDPAYAKAWLESVYGVYHETAPWIALGETEFWAEVLTTGRSTAVTPEVRRSVELYDALLRRDGAALWASVEAELANPSDEEGLARPRILALAGAVALVLIDAPVEQRRAFAAEHMRPHMTDPTVTSEDIAYAMVVAWMET
jgi:spermidine synthase